MSSWALDSVWYSTMPTQPQASAHSSSVANISRYAVWTNTWALACGCVGIVEYQTESSAHELIENYERSYRVTDPKGVADAIVDAGEFEQLTVDEFWRAFDHEDVIEDYLETYRDIQ